ncbi:hypothetical protein J6590_009608 [Homalodisca vitripennis]|nr:hypothetical protein J6590_009608 [Homalodisca vitripennis]
MMGKFWTSDARNIPMDSRSFLSLIEIQSVSEDPEFIESIENDCDVDIVQLPPENVDEVSDQEEINEDDIDDTLPQNIPGNVELHCNINKTTTETEHCVVGAAASVHDELETVFDDEIHENNVTEDETCVDTPSVHSDSKTVPKNENSKKRKRKEVKPANPNKKKEQKEKTAEPKKNKDKNKKLSDWKKIDPIFGCSPPSEESKNEKRKHTEEVLKDKSPVDIFETLYDNEICEHIVRQSIIFAPRKMIILSLFQMTA